MRARPSAKEAAALAMAEIWPDHTLRIPPPEPPARAPLWAEVVVGNYVVVPIEAADLGAYTAGDLIYMATSLQSGRWLLTRLAGEHPGRRLLLLEVLPGLATRFIAQCCIN